MLLNLDSGLNYTKLINLSRWIKCFVRQCTHDTGCLIYEKKVSFFFFCLQRNLNIFFIETLSNAQDKKRTHDHWLLDT